MKLSEEQLSELRELCAHEGLKSLLIEIDNLVTTIEHDIITLSLSSCDEKQLYLRKAHAEGAAKLATAIRTKVQTLKPK